MKILILDEDPRVAEQIRDCLQMGGYSCEIAADGERGLTLAQSGDYAMVILETLLPKRDGFSVCKQLREKSLIPILFLSSNTDELDKVRGFGAGADDYITKPFLPGELVARVKAHMNRYQRFWDAIATKGSGILRIQNLAIDRDAHRVYLDENEISMPVKEYELLLFLAENPNIVFSKERLFDRLWGIDAMSDSSTVTVHIQRIRDKIETKEQKFIETVWGAGYRFRTGQ